MIALGSQFSSLSLSRTQRDTLESRREAAKMDLQWITPRIILAPQGLSGLGEAKLKYLIATSGITS